MLSSSFNAGHAQVFQPGRLTLGFMTPWGHAAGAMADLPEALRLGTLADELGFAALWARDVPLMVPQGSDNTASALDDPFLWLAALAAATHRIAIGAAAIVLPLRHPLHVAKAALSLDRLSNGRFILGMGSGDRPEEFASFGESLDARGEAFRARWPLVRAALSPDAQERQVLLDATGGYDLMLPPAARIPMVVVGSARQSLQWTAANADAWASYHREEARQQGRIHLWQQALEQKAGGERKPFIQSVQLDLLPDPAAPATPLELGLRTGRNELIAYLTRMQAMGVGQVRFNLAQGHLRAPAEVLREIGEQVLPRL
ncbi:TIGR03571 family LLM class oxidoreductase [Acidovorax sp.]|uniref:TIGR03571 family LLM class oxidoreductase n=1 Tax=Acidovorax sp. TaxID=1872122 RepID=UPI00391F3CE3